VAPEAEGSSPHSQQPANVPYPEPGESTPHTPQPISLRSILIPSHSFSITLFKLSDIYLSGVCVAVHVEFNLRNVLTYGKNSLLCVTPFTCFLSVARPTLLAVGQNDVKFEVHHTGYGE
jgi:hypothetical protein